MSSVIVYLLMFISLLVWLFWLVIIRGQVAVLTLTRGVTLWFRLDHWLWLADLGGRTFAYLIKSCSDIPYRVSVML